MRFAVFVCCLVLAVVISDVYGQLDRETQGKLMNVVINQIGKKNEGKFKFLSYTCNYSISRKLKFFKFQYQAKIRCPGHTTYKAQSAKLYSRSEAIEEAVKDYIYQSSKFGALDHYAAQRFIQKYKG